MCRGNGLYDVILYKANALLRNIEEELPVLTSGSETSEIQDAIDPENFDSGNSEIRWDFSNLASLRRDGGFRDVGGSVVPVTLGNSSRSCTSEEVDRVLSSCTYEGD